MVGFTPRESVKLTDTDHAVAGAISGSATRVVCQPLDVLKIRFQLQLEPVSKTAGSKYKGIVQATGIILREEGWRSLWKGHMPAQALSIVYGMAQYSSFEILTQFAWDVLPEELTTTQWRPVTHLLCGGIGGCVATLFVQPMDVLRTRFVAQGEPKIYNSLAEACRTIAKQHGFTGFFKGLTPAMVQIGPQMGFQFGFYSLFTGIWNNANGVLFDSAPGDVESLVCGSGSGMVAKIMIYPLDLVKKRLQVQGFEAARFKFGATQHYSGLVSTLVKVGLEEGVRGLYKGLLPGTLKAGVAAGITFSVYEKLCHLMVDRRERGW